MKSWLADSDLYLGLFNLPEIKIHLNYIWKFSFYHTPDM